MPLEAGRQLSAARALANLSVEEVASLGAWQVQTVHHWEAQADMSNVPIPELEKLIQIFAARGVIFIADQTSLGVYFLAEGVRPYGVRP